MQQQGIKYSSKTLIGNWKEEVALEEAKAASFEKRSINGSGNWNKLQAKMTTCNQVVPLTFSEDGHLKFGDTIILQHDSSGSILGCDPYEEVLIGQKKFAVSGVSNEADPRARSTFTIIRPPERLWNYSDDPSEPILHVGQPFMLRCNESLLYTPESTILSPALYLSSTKKNERTATKGTNKQMVFMSPDCGADAVWTAIVPSQGRKNGAERLLKSGLPVNLSDNYQLTHRQTNMFVTIDSSHPTQTEFGVEYECHADRSTACGKLGLMVSEAQGFSTPATLTKPDAPVFSWHFVTASDKSFSVDNRTLPPAGTTDVILELFQKDIQESEGGFRGFVDYFDDLERRMVKPGKIDREDLKAAIVNFLRGGTLSSDYLDIMIDLVDFDKIGLIDIADFILLCQGGQ
jgi:hypothetical protein